LGNVIKLRKTGITAKWYLFFCKKYLTNIEKRDKPP